VQVEAVKGGLAPEVEKLALALQRKSGRVGQLQERLLSRLRWGVARLQASHAAGVLRHALAGWRCVCPAWSKTPRQPVNTALILAGSCIKSCRNPRHGRPSFCTGWPVQHGGCCLCIA